ncbi:apolipoprotein N-acyltransferase [Chitinophaga skermanii]|uniref:Apolipoprotein N-acyltransferase n=1 Tax=Chitinophaga skermanii TaxID=331697 RepID=A0A327Q1X2_9BACT|nr:apolipoprotein N-acyltransferase [Chitinophaga skermanii]RAI98428.1 apolipoprotein N-acyltransferase [Chitinophaga skermanii]
MRTRFKPVTLSILSGALLWAAWPTFPYATWLIFFAFVPIIYLAQTLKKGYAFTGLAFLALMVWNVGTTWWVGNTPVPISGVFANVFNSLLMLIPLVGFRGATRRFGDKWGYVALVAYWLTFEYVHYNWELSWPWLTVGNVFASHPNWVQWYEYTGASGGTVWVLLLNIWVYSILKSVQFDVKLAVRQLWKPAMAVVVPVILGYSIFYTSNALNINKGGATEVVVVQPNIDPYNEKFNDGSSMEQLEKLLQLSAEKITPNTQYIVWPETALFTNGAIEHQLNFSPEITRIRQFLQPFPKAKIITGAVTYKFYGPNDDKPASTRTSQDGTNYDAFNSALQIDTSQSVQIYHKSKLVPGVELVPYVRYISFMQSLALDMGGVTGSYGRTPGVPFFHNDQQNTNVLPLICYESVYSEFVAEKVREGVNLLVVSTNDGWWGNTQGYKQHLQYASIRAIETRRWVARSANTGSSAFVTPYGEIQQAQPYWEPAVILGKVYMRQDQTMYVRFGDYLAKLAVLACILLLVCTIYHRIRHRKQHA